MFGDVLSTHSLIFLKQSARADKTWLNNFIHDTLTHKKSSMKFIFKICKNE